MRNRDLRDGRYKEGSYLKLPRSIWVLGFVSMFMDTSSELIHSLLPVFMATVLGVSMSAIGFVEGFAEATAAFTKVFSGALSDQFRKRKPLTVLGYGLAAMTKPMFPLATSINWVFTARFVDRIAKGIRGAPRDALVAEIAPPQLRGAAFGLRQALDSVGAFLGPALAIAFMVWFANDMRAVLWVAVLPAFIAVMLLLFGVKEPELQVPASVERNIFSLSNTKLLGRRYWLVVAVGTVFGLARFSEAFLILRAQDLGLAISYVPLVMIVMNVVYSAFAFPAGAAADRWSTYSLLLAGIGLLVAS
ncbi:MAG: MFS transporter, partial [Candidatus Bathyarchaeia archaeon]